MTAIEERALGAFYGQAIGDALGMPTQQLPRQLIADAIGPVRGFLGGPPQNWISAGMPAGMITDDTEQAMIVAELLVEGNGSVDIVEFAGRLRSWERIASARGGEQLGPSTRGALEALEAGKPPDEVGARGDTNGGAMRIVPAGIACRPTPIESLVDVVESACRLTHNTELAIGGAAAVAAVVSIGVDGGTVEEALETAIAAAEAGMQRGNYTAGASVARRIRLAAELARSDLSDGDFVVEVADLIGTGLPSQETVPTAFALALRWPNDAWRACCAAAEMGGDTDTIGAITGAMLGATLGLGAFDDDAVNTVRTVNDFAPEHLVAQLLRVRKG
ncbi:MAG: ADP-ribosylglycohydrolase [Acidimicrobiaceae bacterium]|nr:ADP-ribosylglycohydrolase [Acidimicrobiaceae bacterium]